MSNWLTLTLGLGFVGLVLGGAAGLAGALLAGQVAPAASLAGGLYWALVLALPAALVVLVEMSLGDRPTREQYIRPATAYASLGGAGLAGALAASLAYFISATNVPFIFAQLEPLAMRLALYEAVGWPAIVTVSLVTTGAALLLAAVTLRRAPTLR